MQQVVPSADDDAIAGDDRSRDDRAADRRAGELLAGAPVERQERAVHAREEHAVGAEQRRSREDRRSGLCAPLLAPARRVERVRSAVARADVDDAVGDERRRDAAVERRVLRRRRAGERGVVQRHAPRERAVDAVQARQGRRAVDEVQAVVGRDRAAVDAREPGEVQTSPPSVARRARNLPSTAPT